MGKRNISKVFETHLLIYFGTRYFFISKQRVKGIIDDWVQCNTIGGYVTVPSRMHVHSLANTIEKISANLDEN